jgi:gamma-glutamylcyclotransferase
MSSPHFFSRITSAEIIGPAFLNDKRISFNKRSNDGSGKANLVKRAGDITWGVLYEIDFHDLETLDRVEVGYERVGEQEWKLDGTVVEAVTYVSKILTDYPRAYQWYKELVLSGARENDLPQDYIAHLERLPSKPDRRNCETAG